MPFWDCPDPGHSHGAVDEVVAGLVNRGEIFGPGKLPAEKLQWVKLFLKPYLEYGEEILLLEKFPGNIEKNLVPRMLHPVPSAVVVTKAGPLCPFCCALWCR